MMEWIRPALVITRREIRDQFRDWRVIFPIVGLTVFFPFLMNFTAQQILGFVREYGANIIGERMVPFLLMIVGFFPISVSLVIALETFVGEKERGSIEPLLNTPVEDWQLYVGKLLAATVPPLLSSFLGMGVYLTGLVIDQIPIPSWDLLALIFILTIVQALMMVAGAVVVSSQATSVRSANLLASFIVIPSALLIQGESIVMFWGNYETLWWAVFGLILLTVLLARVGLAHFQREELLGRELDVLNVRWMLTTFFSSFSGRATNPWVWLKKIYTEDLRTMRMPILMTSLIAALGVILGFDQISRFHVPIDSASLLGLSGRLETMTKAWQIGDFGPVFSIFWQNTRAMLLAMVLGFLSLGILGSFPLLLTTGIAGFLLGLLMMNGFSPWTYLAFILPHGIIEIPALIIASASILKAGATMATPTRSRTVSEVSIGSFAEWCRVMVGLVIPFLFLAAIIEAWVTPRIALLFVK